jgi:YD repeat-containing protein
VTHFRGRSAQLEELRDGSTPMSNLWRDIVGDGCGATRMIGLRAVIQVRPRRGGSSAAERRIARSASSSCCVVVAWMIFALVAGKASAAGLTYVYDDLGRLSQVIDAQGNVATYTYDAVGNILAIDRGAPACPPQAPTVSNVTTAAACYAGASCQVTITGDSLLGASVSTGNPEATLSNCQVQCTQATCVLTTTFDFTPGSIQLTAATSFGSAQGTVQVVAAPALQAGGAAGIWQFAANAGQVITLSMTRIASQPNGSSTLDPYLELQDSRGFVIAVDDDSGSNLPPGPGKNAVIQNFTLPATDTYVVVASGAGGTYGSYVLNISPATITLVPGAIVSPPEGRQITFTGTIATIDQRDTFIFAANIGDRATIAVNRVANNQDGSGTLDPGVELHDSRSFLLASDSDTGTDDPPGPGRNALIPNFLLPATDTYQVVVYGEGGSLGPYQVIITLQGSSPSGSGASAAASASGNGRTP